MNSRLGNYDAAYEWLERAREERDAALSYSLSTPFPGLYGMALSEEMLDMPRYARFVESLAIRR